MVMMNDPTAVAALALLLAATSTAAAPLQLILEPAPDYNQAVADSADVLFFRAISPQVENDVCEEVCDPTFPDDVCSFACGGTVPAIDLALYEGAQLTFRASEGNEIYVVSDPETNRVRIEFQAVANCDIACFVDVEGDAFASPTILGSDVDALAGNYNPSRSFVTVGKCGSCGECEIFTRIELSGTSEFSGTMSGITWSAPFDGSVVFAGAGALDFSYNTDDYCWVRTPFEGAIVPVDSPSPAPVDTPTISPMDKAIPTTSGGRRTTGLGTKIMSCFLGRGVVVVVTL